MTIVTFYHDEHDNYIGFEASGHSGYSKSGNDIVCAGISALLTTLVNSLDELTDAKLFFENDAKSGYMKLMVEDNNTEKVQLLFKSSQLGLNEIQENYSKYLKLTNRR